MARSNATTSYGELTGRYARCSLRRLVTRAGNTSNELGMVALLLDSRERVCMFNVDKAVGAAKLPFPTFTPHDLRDAAAPFAIAAGATVKGVQSMLGHKSATQTLDRYASLWPDELDAVAERIDAARRKSRISRTNRGLSAVPS
jgi:hypothetical protein